MPEAATPATFHPLNDPAWALRKAIADIKLPPPQTVALSVFDSMHAGLWPGRPILNADEVAQRTFYYYGRAAMSAACEALASQRWLDARSFDAEGASRRLIKTDEFTFDRCSWCGIRPHAFHEHHFPVPRSAGGESTVRICGTCHVDFHFLVGNRFYSIGHRFETFLIARPFPKEVQ